MTAGPNTTAPENGPVAVDLSLPSSCKCQSGDRTHGCFSKAVEQPICAIVPSKVRVSYWAGAVIGCVSRMGSNSICIPVKVQHWTATRSFNLLGVLASLGLAVCVFAWGLQYKLSLYDPPQAASHRIPQAKLLSRNERSGIAESQLVIRTKTSTRVSYTVPTAVFLILLLPLSILNPQASGQRKQRTRNSWHLRHGLLNIFLVRPPPSLA